MERSSGGRRARPSCVREIATEIVPRRLPRRGGPGQPPYFLSRRAPHAASAARPRPARATTATSAASGPSPSSTPPSVARRSRCPPSAARRTWAVATRAQQRDAEGDADLLGGGDQAGRQALFLVRHAGGGGQAVGDDRAQVAQARPATPPTVASQHPGVRVPRPSSAADEDALPEQRAGQRAAGAEPADDLGATRPGDHRRPRPGPRRPARSRRPTAAALLEVQGQHEDDGGHHREGDQARPGCPTPPSGGAASAGRPAAARRRDSTTHERGEQREARDQRRPARRRGRSRARRRWTGRRSGTADRR